MSQNGNVEQPTNGSRQPRRRNLQVIVKSVNGAVAGIGGVYLATQSIAVTVIGAIVAVLLAALYVTIERS